MLRYVFCLNYGNGMLCFFALWYVFCLSYFRSEVLAKTPVELYRERHEQGTTYLERHHSRSKRMKAGEKEQSRDKNDSGEETNTASPWAVAWLRSTPPPSLP